MSDISQEELNERVRLLHRFKELLQQQRAKYQEYLNVLEKQQNSIECENADNLMAHTELGKQVVENLKTLQKVIVPMKKMCEAHNIQLSTGDKEIETLQNDLTSLQEKVLKQNELNQDLIRSHMESLINRINNFKNPYKNNRSVYARSQPQKVASLVSVEA